MTMSSFKYSTLKYISLDPSNVLGLSNILAETSLSINLLCLGVLADGGGSVWLSDCQNVKKQNINGVKMTRKSETGHCTGHNRNVC